MFGGTDVVAGDSTTSVFSKTTVAREGSTGSFTFLHSSMSFAICAKVSARA